MNKPRGMSFAPPAVAAVIITVLMTTVGIPPGWAESNINTTNKYAWSENAGWLNFRPSDDDGVLVSEKIVTGYVWQENVGWINMGSGTPGDDGYYDNTSGNQWGVNRCATGDNEGRLSGYAWGENVGWINFGSTSPEEVPCAAGPGDWGVTIATADPWRFSGYAWAENAGWINFNRDVVQNSAELQSGTWVALTSFTATQCGPRDCVLLEWESAAEIETAGFHLWRNCTGTGPYERVTDTLIPGKGGPTQGAAYSHEDKAPGSGRGCLYKLEEIDLAGKTSWHGPVSVKGLALCGTMTADSSGFRQKLSVLSRSWALGVLFLPAAAVILGLRRRCRAL